MVYNMSNNKKSVKKVGGSLEKEDATALLASIKEEVSEKVIQKGTPRFIKINNLNKK